MSTQSRIICSTLWFYYPIMTVFFFLNRNRSRLNMTYLIILQDFFFVFNTFFISMYLYIAFIRLLLNTIKIIYRFAGQRNPIPRVTKVFIKFFYFCLRHHYSAIFRNILLLFNTVVVVLLTKKKIEITARACVGLNTNTAYEDILYEMTFLALRKLHGRRLCGFVWKLPVSREFFFVSSVFRPLYLQYQRTESTYLFYYRSFSIISLSTDIFSRYLCIRERIRAPVQRNLPCTHTRAP